MWQEAKANDKRIKELMVDHRKRAERRRAYFESRQGDPQQLIRVIGLSCKVYPDAEQFYYHENPENLMPWPGNPNIRIDRFDGRNLLDFVPDQHKSQSRGFLEITKQDREMSDELNFERYHDLIEAERLNMTEQERLAEVDEEWTKLLDRHQAKLALLKPEKTNNSKSRAIGFDYGTKKVEPEEEEDEDDDKESQLLKQVDILQYVDDLTDKDKHVLYNMSTKYNIKSYVRLLRVAKKDRDEELKALRRKNRDDRPREKGSRRSNERRRRRRRRDRRDNEEYDEERSSGRHSPSYEPYREESSEESSYDEDYPPATRSNNDNSDVVIEFGSSTPEQVDEKQESQQTTITTVAPVTEEKKLTPIEKLKLKMRAGLEKQIVLDEKDKRQKEREKEEERLRQLAKSQGLPLNAYLRPEPPQARYRSPSTSPPPSTKKSSTSKYRSPSPPSKKEGKYRSPSPSSSSRKYRSPSPTKEKRRYRSPSPGDKRNRSPSPKDSKRRYRSPSPRDIKRKYRSPSPRNKRYRSPSPRRYRSPSPKRRHHYRSRSSDRTRNFKR